MMRWDGGPLEPTPEVVVQRQITDALVAFGFVVNDFSQGRETRQTPGIPDLYVWHVTARVAFWIEVKRPAVRLDGRAIQRQGRRSWEQEQWRASALAAGIAVVTADSVELVLAYAAALGCPIPRAAYRAPFVAADQARFYDARARPTLPRPRKRPRLYRPRPRAV